MKKQGILIIISFIIIFCISENSYTQNNSPIIRFGIIADIQYGDCETSGNRYYRNSLQKLEEAVEFFNKENVEFTINLGDLVDRNFNDLDPIVSTLNKSHKKVYNTTGNHDYNGVTNNKILFKKVNMPAEYYSFKKKNWLFIILNTNEIASYANIQGTDKEKEHQTMLQNIKDQKRKNGLSYNGGISEKQMKWLDKQLEKAQKKNENVLIFAHHPLYPEMALNALNDKEILETIDKYNCVKAIFSGHHHPGAFGYYKKIPSVTLEGMVETENKNAFGIVEIYDNKILLNGNGRMKSYEFKLD